MKDSQIHEIIKILRQQYKKYQKPIVTQWAEKRNAFHVLISCLLSLRTKDETTRQASTRLFNVADNPYEIVKLSEKKIEELIYPVGFYHTKANNVLNICETLITDYGGKVPDTIHDLLKLKGVGRKTANLVVTLGFGKPGICVDTHVHRISNRLNYVQTKTPDKTEFALREKLPEQYWLEYNDLLVVYGQNVCKPISPFCSHCAIYDYCERVGVKKSR